jgi:hypothetical protein
MANAASHHPRGRGNDSGIEHATHVRETPL